MDVSSKINEQSPIDSKERDLFEKKIKVKKWLSDPFNLILIALLIFALIIRLYYFSLTLNQPLWWDESEYMLKAKNIAFGTPDTGWAGNLRPILFSLISAAFFKIGLGEIGLRFLIILLSLGNVFLIFLLGSKLFNKRVGIVAAFLFSVFYIDLFYAMRLLVNVHEVFFILLSSYLFIEGYYGTRKRLLWLVVPLMVIGILLRFTVGLFFMIFVFFILCVEGLKFLKNKNIWISLLFGFILYLPFWIWSFFKFHSLNPLYIITSTLKTTGADSGSKAFQVFLTYLKYFPQYTNLLLFVIFFIGFLIILFNFLVGFSTIRKNFEIKRDFLLLLWIIIPLIYFGFFVNHFEDRYLSMIFPAVFLTIGFVLDRFELFLKQYHKYFSVGVMLLLILIGAYQMMSQSDAIIKSKIDSYKELREAGNWIKENSFSNEAVISDGIPEITYYSERATYDHQENLSAEMILANQKNVKYWVISNLEPTPPWVFPYFSQNQTLFKPVYQSVNDYGGGKAFAIVFKL